MLDRLERQWLYFQILRLCVQWCSDDICEFATCVYPGDTNADGAANVYDLLPIGVGYGMEGPPRQINNVELGLDWSAQYSPDWGVETISGQDFKHLDCNGDGEVTNEDAEVIGANYAAPADMFWCASARFRRPFGSTSNGIPF